MNYPSIIVTVPHQAAPKAHIVHSIADLDNLARQFETDNDALPWNPTESDMLEMIREDLHTYDLYESADEFIEGVEELAEQGAGAHGNPARMFAATEAAMELGWC